MLRQRCPQCSVGAIYQARMRMNPRCPVCGLVFEREPGYFMGSLYISYGISCIVLMIGFGIGTLLFEDLHPGWLVLILVVLYLPLVPMVTRYARVLWIYFDRWAWPAPPGGE